MKESFFNEIISSSKKVLSDNIQLRFNPLYIEGGALFFRSELSPAIIPTSSKEYVLIDGISCINIINTNRYRHVFTYESSYQIFGVSSHMLTALRQSVTYDSLKEEMLTATLLSGTVNEAVSSVFEDIKLSIVTFSQAIDGIISDMITVDIYNQN
jgi:hypothetical protein